MRPGERSSLRRSFDAVVRLGDRLELSFAAAVAFAAGFIALGVAVVVLGGVSEDVTRHNGFSTTDPLHLRWFIDHRSSSADTLARWFSMLGSPPVLALVAFAVALLLWWRGTKVLLAIAPGLALVIAAVCAAAGKLVVDRNRPPASLHLVAESDASFPSGHATNTTAVLLTLALVAAVYVLRRPLARAACVAAALLIATVVGVSRLVLGVHWPTDVIAGWALGGAVALAVTLAVSVAVRLEPGDPAPDAKPTRMRRVAHVMYHARQGPSPHAAALALPGVARPARAAPTS
jgi:undecaprenyl-diphosphatase